MTKSTAWAAPLIALLAFALLLICPLGDLGAVVHSFERARSIDIEVSGHTGGASLGVALRGNTAFLALGHELAVLDLDAPEGPLRIGYAQLPSNQQLPELS
jgi:hypothetical protein